MNRTRFGFCVVALLTLVCIATPVAYADTVAFTAPYDAYTNPGNVAGGVYTSPYSGTINGQAVTMICDSYLQRIPGTAWQADAHSLSNLGTARFAGLADAQHLYNAAAYLGDLLLSNTLSDPLMNQVSYAIWALFLPDPDSQYNAFFDAAVAGWVTTALLATNSDANAYANWTVYTPTASAGLPGHILQANQIQEFLVRTPESPALAVLGLNLSGLLGLIVLFRRRLVR